MVFDIGRNVFVLVRKILLSTCLSHIIKILAYRKFILRLIQITFTEKAWHLLIKRKIAG